MASALFQRVGAGQGAQALNDARRLVLGAPSAPDALHLLALCLADAGQTDEAIESLRKALRLAPGQPMMMANLARILRRAGRLQQSIECWRERLSAASDDASAWMGLGLALLDLNRSMFTGLNAESPDLTLCGQAVEALQRAVSLNPGLVSAWHGLGQALREEHRLQDAERALRRALELAPTQLSIWVSFAHLLRLCGRPEEALDAFVKAEALGGVHPEILDGKVGALVDCLRVDEALTLALELVDRYPAFSAAHTTLAHLQWEYGLPQGETGRPEDFFRRAVDAQPNNLDLQMALASFLLESKQADEAFERLQALRRRADDPRLVALQANALEIAGHSERAAVYYAEADVALGARDPSFNIAYVRHLLKSGHWNEAAARLERTLSLDPLRQETWAYLATAWRLLGDGREDWLCDYERLSTLIPVECPPDWSRMAEFLTDVRVLLESLHVARREPVVQSLRGGSQTPGRLFGRPDRRLAALQQTLVAAIEAWLQTLPGDPDHPFLCRAARGIRFTGSWSVKLWQSGSHANHFHRDGWMSSAFYVSLPASVLADADLHASGAGSVPTGSLLLGQPPVELGLNLPPRRIIRPRPGHLALFPSYLWHGTAPFMDEEPRITVAFDMLPLA